MTLKRRMFIGGLGALTPVILNLLVVDYRTVFTDVTLAVAGGYVVRVVVLFFLGGLVAFLHTSETNRLRLFELGIIAPALVTALMNGTNPAVIASSSTAASADSVVVARIPSTAHALSGPGISFAPSRLDARTTDSLLASVPLHAIEPQRESVGEALLRGFTGGDRRARNVWYAVAGSYSSVDEAKLEALSLGSTLKGFMTSVYGPTSESRFLVVFGAGLTSEAADQLLLSARRAGFSGTGFRWQAQ